MILKWNIGRLKIGLGIHLSGKKDIYGYTNRCDDGKFIVFLDYDDLPFEWVGTEINWLQKDFNLGDFYLFRSSMDSYHAVCFSKVSMHTLMSILYNSTVDENYYRIPYIIGKKLLTLRLNDKHNKKIKFLGILHSHSDRLESKEHKVFFNNLFHNISIFDLNRNNDDAHPTNIICSNYKVK